MVNRHEPDRDGEQLREVLVRQEIEALQFLAEDERQLVQIRQGGFLLLLSFNWLAPYTILADYVVEISPATGVTGVRGHIHRGQDARGPDPDAFAR